MIIERWRRIRTRRISGHFRESEKWELSWKHESSSAGDSDPPKSPSGLDLFAQPVRNVYVWPELIPDDVLQLEGVSSDVYDMALEATMKPPDFQH